MNDRWNEALEAAADKLLVRACGYLARYDTIYNGRIVSEELLCLAKAIFALREASPGGQEKVTPAPDGLWVVWFEDAEVRPEVFYGHGAENAAKEFYKQKIASWSCHLLCRVPDPGGQELASSDPEGHLQAMSDAELPASASPGHDYCEADHGYCLLCGSLPMGGGCWAGLPLAAVEEGRDA